MSKMLVSKSSVNIRTISNITALTTFILLTGCQTLPSTMSKTMQAPANNMSASNPLTARMPMMDRQGRIAYVEEQGIGAAKMSTLYSIRPDGSDRKSNIRNLVVNAEGSNMSASFSPNGQKLLYSSTVGGNADIYEMRLSDGKTTQLTTLLSTEVQPSYASDGQSFVYTSDKVRAGRPRIYRYHFETASATPVPTSGYVASPQLSLDGQRMAYLNGRKAAVMTLSTGQITNLAETGLDEPARLSPSAQYAVYPTKLSQVGGQNGGSLVIHSLSGNTSYAIGSKVGGVVRSPIWGR
ncbi:PD40 domain-containing protein [Psychrobacter sp. Ps4]|uniref:Xaa-Pro aminopeptidase n=1 Tax=Psychrobacter sp. Ps4 TaxID=2790958 RepID=UPI001EDD75C0|nr:Xaa-Pro aminopeptidase [Psychrobacter sp. Ps4]MCG3809969.1 PD40 domain-containing protein [Psychrobacter sp. Ps4]